MTLAIASGVLIGSEVASVPQLLGAGAREVVLLGDPTLCRWYERALTARGVQSSTYDGEEAALTALTALQMETRP